ncbi:MAG: 3-hydroxyacyl-CoA dehydrogenase [Anaerolineae bacterium]|nr:3-hydroxyacyl-CoA dehydrogenase [Anaerolineae bacterium]
MQIQDRSFFITGGGSGLGAATAQVLVEAGGNVTLADVNREAGQALADSLGRQAQFVETNVADAVSVQLALDTAVEKFGPLAGAVNCAGIVLAKKTLGRKGPHDLLSFSKVIQVNLIGTFNVLRLAADMMVDNAPWEEGERGVIVNTASIAAFEGQIGQAAYAASKGGVVSLTLPVARELAQYGIRVVTIAPGIFETPMMASLPEPARESLGKQVPFPSRLGRPGEYAALVKHIVENIMLNGEVIRLDGAMRLSSR